MRTKVEGLPVGLNNAYIPVVTEEVVTPPENAGTALSEQRLWYKYSSDDNQHNYTGYQNGGSMESGKDNLMDRPDNYIYQTTVDNGLTSTTTRYNKYHLPLSVTQTDNQHHSLLAQSAEQYSPWKNTTFSQLPPDYSFPRQAIKTLYALDGQQQDAAITPATVIQQKKYNNNGQMIWQRDAYGRQTFTQYCPSRGDSHCPAMDADWPQIMLPEKVLNVPASQTPTGSSPYTVFATDDPAPAVETVFDYTRMPVAQKYVHSRWA